MRSSLFNDSKYTKWYFQIIYKAFGQNRRKNSTEYFEEHHIIPDSLDGSDSKWNLVLLTAREHFIVHWLLTKCLEGEDKVKMIYAFHRTANSLKVRLTSRQYEIAKEKYVNELKKLKLEKFKEEIIDLYVNKKLSVTKIAEKFNCSDTPIRNILIKYEIKFRTQYEHNVGRYKSKLYSNVEDIIKLYQNGYSILKICGIYKTSNTRTIKNILTTHNIKIRKKYKKKSMLEPYKDEIVDLYINKKLSTYKIAEKFKCCYGNIIRFLRENGIEIRSASEVGLNKFKLKNIDKDEIIDMYVRQELSTIEIAKKFNVNSETIRNFLKRNNVKLRNYSEAQLANLKN